MRAFRDALAKLQLNDSALHYEPEVSTALGFGFRCGFLGLLHMDIVQERLEREYQLSTWSPARPRSVYEVLRTRRRASSTSTTPPSCRRSTKIDEMREPIIIANILLPPGLRRPGDEAVHSTSAACRRSMLYLGQPGVHAVRAAARRKSCSTSSTGLKSVQPRLRLVRLRVRPTSRPAPLVKLDILINGDPVDALLDHRAPRQRLPARPRAGRQDAGADPAPDVRGGDPGGHRRARSSRARRSRRCARTCSRSATAATSSRKRKLLEKQKEGKKRMKQVGQVEIPQEAFLAVLQVGRRHYETAHAAEPDATTDRPHVLSRYGGSGERPICRRRRLVSCRPAPAPSSPPPPRHAGGAIAPFMTLLAHRAAGAHRRRGARCGCCSPSGLDPARRCTASSAITGVLTVRSYVAVLRRRPRRAAAARAAGQVIRAGDHRAVGHGRPTRAASSRSRSIVRLLRSFIFEPFRIPSDSMMPGPCSTATSSSSTSSLACGSVVLNKKIVAVGSRGAGDAVPLAQDPPPTSSAWWAAGRPRRSAR